MLRRNLSVKIGFGYLNGGAGFFLCGFPWIEFWWWLCSAIGWNVLKVDEKEDDRERWYEISNREVIHIFLFNFMEIYHSSSESHEEILEISPGRFAHSLAVRTFKAGETGDKLSVALTQLVATAVSSFANWNKKMRTFPWNEWCCYIYHSTEPLRYTSTCRGRSRGGCTGRTCRRWWCSTSRASYSTWGQLG